VEEGALRRLAVVILAVLAVIVVTAAYFALKPPAPTKLRVIVYAYSDTITGIDPSLEDDTGLIILGLVYETLTYYDHSTGSIKPRLAVNWTVSEDGTEWIFHLRKGVLFHDGTPFNATAVKLSIERARDAYRETGRGLGYIWDAVEEIEILDEYTVKLKLSHPQRLDFLAAATYSAYIFSPSVMAKSGATNYLDKRLEEWFNSGNAVGTGPYKLVYYDPMREIRLEKFDKWWGWEYVNNPEAPDVVIIKIVLDPATQYSGLLSGEIDIACCVPRVNVPELAKKGFRVEEVQTYRNFVMFFNTKRYPTNVREFRLAIAHAINLTAVIKNVLLGYGRQASGVIPFGFPGHIEGLIYEFNLTIAKNYLEKSGVTKPVKIEVLYQKDYEETVQFALLLKTVLEHELGIAVELNPQGWEMLRDIARGIWESPETTPHIIIADWWPTILSPYDYLYTMFHSESREWNFAGYENAEFNKLIEEAWALEGVDYEKAMEMYAQAQRIIYEEAVAVGLWDDVRPYVYSSKLLIPKEAFSPYYMYVIRFELVKVRE
jgi:peptide/nickel transport system substrate-binding protein